MSFDHRRPAPLGPSGPTARAPSHAERCRTLASQATSATLSTIARDPVGFPYGSLVTVAVDDAGRPLLLLSELAEHTEQPARAAGRLGPADRAARRARRSPSRWAA